jgi:WD40 repeat protein/class 3 adenylate cyclase
VAGSVVRRTFMIADIRGWTRFTREHGDAAAARLADVFAELARDAVEARGGEVLELRGDEAMSVFSGEAQAVRAALEFQRLCAESYDEDPTLLLNVGIGVDAGDAIAVQGGFRGKALNMAARLCSNAGAGQVFVSTAVAAAIGVAPDLTVHERGDANLKGFEGAVPLLEAVDARSEVPAPGSAPATDTLPPELDTSTRLVGREHEMRWLRGTWRQAERGRGRVVVLAGPPGIGKSRLASEVATYVDRRGGTVRYVGLGGTAAARATNAVQGAATATVPTLLVLDDLDGMGDAVVSALDRAMGSIEDRAVLVVATVQDPHGDPAVATLVDHVDVRGDGARRPSPLDMDGVRDIVGEYVDLEAEEVPLEALARSSGGTPGRVHEVVSAWAEQEAARRMAAATEWIAATRAQRDADLAFANNVIGRRLTRLYAGDPVGGSAADACPYRGLASFTDEDAGAFFGREALVGELAARTVQQGLLGVVGASGAGKSSVIAAGLVPSLRAGLLPGSARWVSASMRPGEHPLESYRAAIEAVEGLDERLVLIVDQFEEAFTLCAEEHERAAFIDALTATASDPDRAIVILGVRGDHYGSCAPYTSLAGSLATNNVLVGPMTRDELRRAIELPARRAGRKVEGALVERLIEETLDQPGGLPLLSTALVELWHRSTDSWLRLETYERTGGVRGAVARLAERSYGELTTTQQDVAKAIFLRLVATGDDDVIGRRRVPLEEFDADRDPVTAAVLARLATDRLLTRNEGTVEVAHEALLREWPRLRAWIDDDAQGRQLRGHLTTAAKQWAAADRDPAEVYRGARLSAALDWSTAHGTELNELERSFLQESRAASERDADRQRRANRRLKGLLAGVASLLVLALVAGVLAQQRSVEARRQTTIADAQRIGALAIAEQRPDLALLLAAEGFRLADTPETRGDLISTLRRYPHMLSITQPTGGQILRLEASPDGGVFAVSDQTGGVALYDGASLQQLYPPITLPFTDEMVFGSDGRTLYLAGWATKDDGSRMALRALDVASGTVRWEVPIPASERDTRQEDAGVPGSGHLATTPGGREVTWRVPDEMHFYDGATGDEGRSPVATTPDTEDYVLPKGRMLELSWGRVRVLDLDSGRVDRSWRVTAPLNAGSAISPDGREVAVGGWDGTADGVVAVIDLRSGEVRSMHGQHHGWIPALAWSADGNLLASVDDGGNVFVWNPDTGDLVRSLVGHAPLLRGAAFVDGGRTLVTGGLDDQLIAWDMSNRRGFLRQAPRPGPPCDDNCAFAHFGFSPDGAHLLSLDAPVHGGYRIRLLDPRTFVQQRILPPAVTDCCMFPALSPDGSELVTIDPSPDFSRASLRLVDTTTGRVVRTLYRSGQPSVSRYASSAPPIDTGAFAPDGSVVATNENADVLVIDPATARVMGRLPAGDYVEWVAFSPDGSRLLASSDDGHVTVWDTGSLQRLWSNEIDDDIALGGQFSPDGSLVIAGSFSGRIHVVDARTGEEIQQQRVLAHARIVGSLHFSPDGATYATSGVDGKTFLWDTATGRSLGEPFEAGAPSMSQFSPDGKTLYVSTFGGFSAFDVSPDAMIARACSIAGRTFTQGEWDRYLPDRPFDDPCT